MASEQTWETSKKEDASNIYTSTIEKRKWEETGQVHTKNYTWLQGHVEEEIRRDWSIQHKPYPKQIQKTQMLHMQKERPYSQILSNKIRRRKTRSWTTWNWKTRNFKLVSYHPNTIRSHWNSKDTQTNHWTKVSWMYTLLNKWYLEGDRPRTLGQHMVYQQSNR